MVVVEFDGRGCTELHNAVLGCHLDLIQRLLDEGWNVDERAREGATPLSHATGATDVLHLLLKHGADVNGSDCNGYTALHCACMLDHIDAVVMLLNAGANPELKTALGATAVDMASESGYERLVEIIKAYQCSSAAYRAIEHSNPEAIASVQPL